MMDDGVMQKGKKHFAGIKLDFEVEVVQLSESLVEKARQKQLENDGSFTSDRNPRSGIRRKRIKGDTFLYKGVVNSILSEIDQSC